MDLVSLEAQITSIAMARTLFRKIEIQQHHGCQYSHIHKANALNGHHSDCSEVAVIMGELKGRLITWFLGKSFFNSKSKMVS